MLFNRFNFLLHRSTVASFDDSPVQMLSVVPLPDTQLCSINEIIIDDLSLSGQNKYTPAPDEPPSESKLSFHHIDYIVGAKQLNLPCKKCLPACMKPKESKQILYDVSGMFKSGLNAIMGKKCSHSAVKHDRCPSHWLKVSISRKRSDASEIFLGPTGCGKSSLLDILADRKNSHGLSGQILLNGMVRDSSFKYTVGYVVQEDIITGTLTVRENLMFSANVRLPKGISRSEREDRVTKVINELGLESCADTRIGTEFLRGVSGGERRRACIGMELVLSPKVLFLDEPTTGL
jgi:ABC-type lipoprotein export system ATPase subunit